MNTGKTIRFGISAALLVVAATSLNGQVPRPGQEREIKRNQPPITRILEDFDAMLRDKSLWAITNDVSKASPSERDRILRTVKDSNGLRQRGVPVPQDVNVAYKLILGYDSRSEAETGAYLEVEFPDWVYDPQARLPQYGDREQDCGENEYLGCNKRCGSIPSNCVVYGTLLRHTTCFDKTEVCWYQCECQAKGT